MRIHELEVTDTRGIRHILISPAGENLVICGPNGSGKSAIVDAVDFLLRGTMGRLEGDGAGSLSTAKHGPHVLASSASARVRATVSVDGVDGEFALSRTMAAPGALQAPAETMDALRPILQVAAAGQFVLARREILRLITVTGGTRAKWIQTLLRLDDLEVVRASLVTAANDAKKAASGARNALSEQKASAAAILGIAAWSEDGALERVNAARSILGALPLDRLESALLKTNVTPQTLNAVDSSAAKAKQLAEGAARDYDQNLPPLRAAAATLYDAASTMCACETDLLLLRRHNLIHLGREALGDDDACPLCGTEWPAGALAARLDAEMQAAEELVEKRDAVTSQASKVTATVKALRQVLSQTVREAQALGFEEESSSLATCVDELEAYEASLGEALEYLTAETLQSWRLPSSFAGDGPQVACQRIAERAAAIAPSLTPEQSAWDTLTRASDAIDAIERSSRSAESAALVHAKATAVKDAFVASKDATLNGLYEAIKDRFVSLYSQLHEEDGEAGFDAVLEHSGAALDLQVDFFGVGMYPPHAVHSEGHQDSMGLCLYLALSEYVDRGMVGLCVLDDVVMSVDSGHRRRLCKVLRDNFPGRQFIITTHDRSWAGQLRSEGLVTAANTLRFSGWSLDGGPQVGDGDCWAQIDERLAAGDVTSAAGLLRRAMEERFSTVCESLQSRVPYRSSGSYTLGDLLPAADERYKALLRRAKKSAQSWGDESAYEAATDAESIAQQCYARTTAEQWAANKGIHYEDWYQLEPADLVDVVNAFRDESAVFECSSCGTTLGVSTTAGVLDSLRCACGKVNLNLRSKND